MILGLGTAIRLPARVGGIDFRQQEWLKLAVEWCWQGLIRAIDLVDDQQRRPAQISASPPVSGSISTSQTWQPLGKLPERAR
jgi:hypothetical protein